MGNRQTKSALADSNFLSPNRSSISDDVGTAWDWLFLAMISVKMNDQEAAKKWLKLAEDRLDLEAGNSWVLRSELELLLAEAKQLMGESGA